MPRRDTLIALGLAVAGQVEVWAFWVPDEQGSKPLAAAFMLVMAAPLAWTTRRPFASVAAVSVVLATWVLVAVPGGSLMPLVMVMVAVFGVAARTPLRTALAGGGLGLAAIWLIFATTDDDFANYTFTGVFIVGAWIGGRLVAGRQARADHLEARAHRLELQQATAIAEERARIARELHDVVAHSVSVMVIQAQAAQHAADDGVRGTALRSIESTGQQALVEMRRLLGLLRRPDDELALAPQPSLKHLDHLAETVRRAGLPVELRVEGEPAPLPPGVDLSAYRIVQEALTNALKHAGPARALVLVSYRPDEIELEVSDDGSGADATPARPTGGGHGLAGMRERVDVYGGVLESGRQPGGGYALRVRLPFER
jgi:signal transduction histidine kinase